MRFLFVLMSFAIGFASCQSSSSANQDNSSDGVINKVLSCADFDAKIKEGGQLVDVRTAGEFGGGAVEGAMNIDYNGASFKDEMEKLDKEKPVLVYCQKGGRSGKSAAKLKDMGFKEVYDMEGGYTAWQNYKAGH